MADAVASASETARLRPGVTLGAAGADVDAEAELDSSAGA